MTTNVTVPATPTSTSTPPRSSHLIVSSTTPGGTTTGSPSHLSLPSTTPAGTTTGSPSNLSLPSTTPAGTTTGSPSLATGTTQNAAPSFLQGLSNITTEEMSNDQSICYFGALKFVNYKHTQGNL